MSSSDLKKTKRRLPEEAGAFFHKLRFLDGTAIKLIAILSMTLDHIGYLFFPEQVWWRIAGRLAFPVFAWMIAEGCYYTRNIRRYLARVFVLAIICQAAYTAADRSLYINVLITLSLSILLIIVYQKLQEKLTAGRILVFAAVMAGDIFLTRILPRLVPAVGFAVDYGFFGTIMPLTIYALHGKDKIRIPACAANLLLLCIGAPAFQIWGLAALALFIFYNGKPGKFRMKYFFYLYYPAHLLVLYGLSLLLET
ncbi:MAG: TraX family protein [Eubacterium sp.]|nr:TraX family protein [Eubacterium sp.]